VDFLDSGIEHADLVVITRNEDGTPNGYQCTPAGATYCMFFFSLLISRTIYASEC